MSQPLMFACLLLLLLLPPLLLFDAPHSPAAQAAQACAAHQLRPAQKAPPHRAAGPLRHHHL
jgi:hypothetical protein